MDKQKIYLLVFALLFYAAISGLKKELSNGMNTEKMSAL